MSVHFATFPGLVENVGLARRFVTGVLRAVPDVVVPPCVVEKAELITSELCTNAVVHTLSGDPGRSFHVHVQVDQRGVWAEIHTRQPRDLYSVPHVQKPDPDAESGRGLFLVDALATRWGPLTPLRDGVYFVLQWLPEQHAAPDRAEPTGAW